MKIGDLDLGRKLLLAPMVDVTDAPFRKIAKEYGAGITFTQMISAKGVIDNDFDTLRVLAYSRDEKPIGVQLLGNNPEYLSAAVREIKQFKPDIIDLNCGCSVDTVTKHNLGANLLDDPKFLGKLLNSMVNAADGIPISAKLRLGRDQKAINILENAKIAEENGAAIIIVHARTRRTRYDEEAKWEWLKEVKESVSIPVVGNGSVFNPNDIQNMIDQTGCDSVMIARGALGDPFIFRRYNSFVETGIDPGEPGIAEIKEVALKHLQLLVLEYGEDVGINKAKKNIIWYFKKLDGINSLLNEIFSIKTNEGLKNLIIVHSEKIENEYFPKEDHEIINKKFNEKVLFWLDD